MEGGLGVNLERPVLLPEPHQAAYHLQGLRHFLGEIIEPGNFAVDKNVNAQAYRAITLELLKAVYDETHSTDYNQNGKVLYSYADAMGRKLYLPMGFELVDVKDPIVHDDIKWWVIRLTPERLKNWIDSLEKRAHWTPDETAELRDALEVFSQPERLSSQRITPPSVGSHGLVMPVGYSSDHQVQKDLADLEAARLDAFEGKWRPALGSLSDDEARALAAPYEKLLKDLTLARAKQERLMPSWEQDLAVRYQNGWPAGIEMVGSVTPVQMQGWFGPLWRSTYILDRMMVDLSRPYRGKADEFFSDLSTAMAEEPTERATSARVYTPAEIDHRLIEHMSRKGRERSGC